MYFINRFNIIFTYLLLGCSFISCSKNSLPQENTAKNSPINIYPYAEGAILAKDYKLFINGKETAVYETSEGAFASYGAEGTAEIKVVYFGQQPIKKVDIRPKSRNIEYKQIKNEIQFNLTAGPLKTVVEINEDLERPLFIFTNPIEKNKPSPNAANVRYFKAGKVYQIGEIKPESGETIYIEGGAVVKGNININNSNNIKVYGFGILDGRGSKKTVRIEKSSDISWEGTTILNDSNWAFIAFTSNRININNINILSYGTISTDGLDVLGSNDVTIKNSFMCAEDDAIAIKTEKFGKFGPVSNVDIRNCVIFNKEPGNGLEIGYEINHDVSDVSFTDIDIIHTLSTIGKPFKRAAISIHNAGKGTVSNISYKNINIEDARENLIYLSIFSSEFSPANYTPGKIKNVSFENIRVTGGEFMPSVIKGYDDQHNISNITFNNLLIKETCIGQATEGKFSLTHADQVKFTCTGK
jgi:hypothetical protein